MDDILDEKIDLPDVPSAPPPPTELKIRTMRSDLESMEKTGGGSPQFQSIAVPKLSIGNGGGNPNAQFTAPAPAEVSSASGAGRKGLVIALIIIAVLAVGILAYSAYLVFMNGAKNAPASGNAADTGTNAAAGTAPPATSSAPSSSSVPSSLSAPFIHASLFKKPADQTLIFTLGTAGTATSAADLQTFAQKLAALLASARKNAGVIEVAVQTPDKHGVAAGDLLAAMNAPILSAQALAHFNPDATFFVYQDQNGFWPGLILALNPGESPATAGADVTALESSSNITNFFLTNVGAPVGGFVDGTTGTSTVRVLQFVNATPPAYFVYGWDRNYLILSGSEDGFSAAVARL